MSARAAREEAVDPVSGPLAAADLGRSLRLALVALAVLYALGHELWYAATPLGRVPLLDGRELLDMALAIANGTLPHEPFYRAPLYPAALAVPLRLGLDPGWLPAAARALNFVAHCATGLALARIARVLGGGALAGALAAALWIAYPVALHLAGDAFDISFALALLCLGIALAFPAVAGTPSAPRAAGGTLLASLAVAARPNLLPVALALALLLAWRGWTAQRRLAPGVAAGAALATVLMALGAANALYGNEFRILPWQGAYNLWAANRPESNGRYYEQLVEIRNVDAHRNPARLEAELLYRREVPDGPEDIEAMNRHWRERFLARVAADPLGFGALVARRAGYLFNNFEQYDNKTYWYQSASAPWLRWNPLGFGVLAVAAAAALAARRPGRIELAYLVLPASYLAGALLFYASDRFRLPLAALLVPLAALAPARLRAGAPLTTAAVAACAAIATFWPLPRSLREATVPNDLMLEAQAALEIGRFDAAAAKAEAALALDRRPALGWELLCVARYDQLLARLPEPLGPDADRRGLEPCLAAATRSDRARALGAVYRWRTGDESAALAAWRELARSDSPARSDACAFLTLVGELPASPPPACLRGEGSGVATVLLALLGDPAARAELPVGTNLARERARLQALLAANDPPRPQ